MMSPFEFNSINAVIDSDTALNQCLMNFSEDYIYSTIDQALLYRFRPYSSMMPNIVASLEQQFMSIGDSIRGADDTPLRELRHRVYENIIDKICEFYDLTMTENPIDHDDDNYQLANLLFQIFISNLSSSFINMLVNIIYTNRASVVANMREDQKVYKTSYTKTILNDIPDAQNLGIIIDNIESALDIVSGFDIDLFHLILELTGREEIARYITGYISDNRDIYKNKFISLLSDKDSRVDIITNVKIGVMNRIISEYPSVGSIDPYILNK